MVTYTRIENGICRDGVVQQTLWECPKQISDRSIYMHVLDGFWLFCWLLFSGATNDSILHTQNRHEIIKCGVWHGASVAFRNNKKIYCSSKIGLWLLNVISLCALCSVRPEARVYFHFFLVLCVITDIPRFPRFWNRAKGLLSHTRHTPCIGQCDMPSETSAAGHFWHQHPNWIDENTQSKHTHRGRGYLSTISTFYNTKLYGVFVAVWHFNAIGFKVEARSSTFVEVCNKLMRANDEHNIIFDYRRWRVELSVILCSFFSSYYRDLPMMPVCLISYTILCAFFFSKSINWMHSKIP